MEALYVVSCIFDAFVIYLLFEVFLQKRKETVSKWYIVFGLLVQQIITTLISNHTQSVYVRLVVQIIGVFLLTLFYEGSFIKHLLAMAVFVGFSVVSEGIAEVSIFVMGIEQGKSEEIILLLLVEIFMLILVLVAKVFSNKVGDIPARYQIGYLFVPILSVIVINGMISSKPTISWLVSLISILVMNMIAYSLLNTLTGYIMEQNRKKQMEQQIETQKEKYEQLSEYFIQGNRLVHDINKHHRILKEYLLASNEEEALKYIEKIDDSFKEMYSSVNTGNLVIDSIVGRFQKCLEHNNCHNAISINIDKNQKIMEDYDLVIVLGNITDNILEALSVHEDGIIPSVELKLETTNTAFILYSKNDVFEKKREQKNKWYHGLGLSNVKETVEKYGGTMVVNRSKYYYETMIQVPIRGEQK